MAIIRVNFEANTASLINGMNRASRSVDQASGRINRSMDKARIATRRFIGSFAGAISVREFARTADEMTSLTARIRNSTRDVEEFNKAFTALNKTAVQTGGSLSASVDVFQRISFVREEIKATVEQMTQFTDTVQKLGVVSGAGPQALEAGLLQLGQGLSSNILRAEEFNSIMENIPAVGVAIAEEFGVSTGQLRQLVIAGEVLSKDVFAAILNQSQKANEQFEKMPMTVGRALGGLKNQLALSVVEIDKMANGSKVFIAGIGAAGQLLQSFVGLLTGFGNSWKAFFTLVVAGIMEAVDRAAIQVKKLINLSITGINLLKKEDIPLLSVEPSFDYGTFAQDAFDMAKEDARKAADGFKKAFEGAWNATDIVVTGRVDAQAVMPETAELQDISKGYAAIAENIGEVNKKSKIGARYLNQNNDAAKSLQRSFTDLGGTMSSAFEDAITQGSKLSDVLRGLLADIQRIFMRQFVTNPLSNALTGFLSAGSFVGSSGTANFSSRSMTSLMSSAMKGAYGPGFATGGIATSPSIFGEAGPEAAVPLPDGRRIPVDLRGGTGGGGQTIYMDLRGSNGEASIEAAVRRGIAQASPGLVNASVSKVRDTIRRDPSFARA